MIDLDAGIGYLWRNDEETTEKLMASASELHLPTGFNLTLSAGDQRGDDASFISDQSGRYRRFGGLLRRVRFRDVRLRLDLMGHSGGAELR